MNLEILSLFSLIIVLLVILVRAADFIEDGFVFLARSLKVNEFFIGFVILSAVSSLPEFSIALNSNNTIPELSVGNLMGASLVLLTLVIGFTAYRFDGIEFKGKFRETEVIEGLLLIAAGILSLLDGKLHIGEGIALMILYTLYATHIFLRYRTKHRHQSKTETMVPSRKVLKMFGKSVAGIIMILIASSLIVDTAIQIGKTIEVSESFIGLFVLAIGTNIPEITLLFRAKRARQRNLALGNFMGSATINMFILGLLAVLSQGVDLTSGNATNFIALTPVMVILSLTLLAFTLFSWTGKRLSRLEGAMLIGFYLSLLITEGILLIVN